MENARHWEEIYRTRAPDEVSWYEPDPLTSRTLITEAIGRGARSVIDVGGGASSLVDRLLELGLERIAVLDVSHAGLEVSRQRLGERANLLEWIEANVTEVDDVGRFDVWHDRAVFHFLITDEDRRRYVRLAEHTVGPGGTVVIATFASDGPDRCSGLPVQRYDAHELAHELGVGFELVRNEQHVHTTPAGGRQNFLYATFRRMA